MFQTSSRIIKIGLLVLFLVALAILAFVIIEQKMNLQKQMTTPATPTTPSASFISPEDAQKKFEEIRKQVADGTLSLEEATQQIDALGAQMAPPEIPPEAKK